MHVLRWYGAMLLHMRLGVLRFGAPPWYLPISTALLTDHASNTIVGQLRFTDMVEDLRMHIRLTHVKWVVTFRTVRVICQIKFRNEARQITKQMTHRGYIKDAGTT